jgi:hypothetical protein
MTREEFSQLLDEADLKKREFCELLELKYDTVNTWGSSGKVIPQWVKSWLVMYKELKKCERLKTALKESGICNTLEDTL